MKFKTIVFIILCLFAFSVPGLSEGPVTVLYVYDGDTLQLDIEGRRERVRLIGIDTPESYNNDRAVRIASRTGKDVRTIIAEGKRASAFVRNIVRVGDEVTIEYDTERRDRYNRLLGYVYLSDGRMLNELIIKSGYAYPLTIQPNVKYKECFLRAFRYAQNNNIGLWNQK